MMGSGSVIIAGIKLGMTCVGVDIDTSAYATAKQRVEHYVEKLKKAKDAKNSENTNDENVTDDAA